MDASEAHTVDGEIKDPSDSPSDKGWVSLDEEEDYEVVGGGRGEGGGGGEREGDMQGID